MLPKMLPDAIQSHATADRRGCHAQYRICSLLMSIYLIFVREATAAHHERSSASELLFALAKLTARGIRSTKASGEIGL